MKRKIFSKGRLFIAVLLLTALISVTNSCKKSSDTPGPNEVFIENMAFNPGTIRVSLNATVTWVNKDGVDHTVTSTNGQFDSGLISKNGTYSYTFTTAGTYSYYCTPHPSMLGTVIVNVSQSDGGGGY